MITKTQFYDYYDPWPGLKRDVSKKESEGWAVRQILQSNGTTWVVVYERERPVED